MFADNYMEDNITAAFAAKVAVHAAYDAGAGANMVISDYDSEEEIEDPDEWDTAFLASLVYNGGIVDWDSVDDRCNKEFWNWYLTDCIKNCLCGWQAAIPLFRKQKQHHQQKYIPYRTQLRLWKRRCENVVPV